MRALLSALSILVLVVILAEDGYGQQATEQFIPVGKSPGISGEYSYFGSIQQVDAQNRTITVQGAAGQHTVKVTDATRIWLDRSQTGKSNTTGSFDDLEPGRRIEMKYVNYEKKEAADWIKVVAGG